MAAMRVLDEFAPADVDAITRLAAEIEAESGVEPLSDDAWTGIHREEAGRDRGLLVAAPESDGRSGIDAYVHLARHHEGEWGIELVVRPGFTGSRSELLAAALDVVGVEGGGHVTWWAHGATADDDELARGASFTLERELQQLRVPLPLPDPPRWPDGITVRAFVPGRDEAEWVEVNNRAFAGHVEQGDWTVETLLQRETEAWFDPEGFLLAFDDAGLAGFCWTKVHPVRPPAEPVALGEIYVIGADPARHGKGLGRALAAGGLSSLAERGIKLGMLFVDAANDAAVGLYGSLGLSLYRTDRAFGRTIAPHP
jgi:mycothiol synthase